MLLQPYRALDLTDERGLICGQLLADLGADVIAVEPPGGSPARRLGPFAGDTPGTEQSLYWQAYARGKRSVVLDITAPAERERLLGLARSADLLIESFAPGYLDGLGLGYAALSAINPWLVVVSITPFGQTGPKAHWAATDLTALAASGTLLLTGDGDRPPLRLRVPQAFLHAGAEAAAAALIALAARERDGLGQHVDVSAQTAAMIATQFMMLQAGWGEKPLSRVGGGIKLGPIHMQFFHPCKDGYVSVTFLFGSAFGGFTGRLMQWVFEEGIIDAATRDKDWLNYATLLVTGAEPVSELQRCNAAISALTARYTKAELFGAALRRGLLIAPVSTTADVVHSEQLAARAYWTPVTRTAAPDAPPQTALFPGPFAKFGATPIRYTRPAPRLGEHTAEVLAETARSRPPLGIAHVALARGPGGEATPPLAGVNVLDFTWVIVGPSGVRYLADHGATVVHIESSTRIDAGRSFQPFKDAVAGAERSGLYATAQANKLGVTLNLAKPEARAVARKLAAWADIVVESYTPGQMARWGLDYASLREANPALIMLSTCLNGQDGPHAGLAGFGTMGAVLAGFGGLAGWPDRPPAGPMGAYTDYVAPKLIAAALLAALDHRRRTGEGQYIDLAQAEAAMHFLTPALLDYTVNGRVEGGNGNASDEHAPHGVYACVAEPLGEGEAPSERWIALACGSEAEWQALCRVAGREDWAADSRFATLAARQQNAATLDEAIGAWTAGQAVAELEARLQAAGVPAHRASASVDALADPQLAHRGHFAWVDHPIVGHVPIETARFRLSRTPAVPITPGATYGRDNERVLRDILGLSDEELVELAVAGALE